MKNLSKIANAHCNLFRLHDDQNWSEFRKNVVIYAVNLGYKKTNAEKASYHVVNAYQKSDRAVIAQQKGDIELEREMYEAVLEEFILAHKLLGAETKSPKYKVGWYIGARHKKHAKVLWNLYMEHFSKFGWDKLGLSFYTTYLTFAKAYPAHNSHNWKNLRSVLKTYWDVTIRAYPNFEKVPIEL